MTLQQDIGNKGEHLAKKYLQNAGLEILAENWRYKRAEIDIIAKDMGQIVFIEVKARSSTDFGNPEDFVDDSKQKLMAMAAEAYIEELGYEGELRFDIVAVDLSGYKEKIKHIKDAFYPHHFE